MTDTPPPLPSRTLDPKSDLDDRRRRRKEREGADRTKSTKAAAVWVLVIALIQVGFGLFTGFSNQKVADQAIANLAQFSDDELLDLEDGTKERAKDLRAAIERERLQMFVVPIGIGVVFLALWLWARKSPLPALSTALALFVTMHAIEAVVEPKSLGRGVIMKVFCTMALIRGIQSALQQRALEQRQAAALVDE
ncbi:MAG: hypothetical protein JNK15_02645 [Planctomycetes bacterium]|nr:hypothetical protein [Planctomycetota bacterium]